MNLTIRNSIAYAFANMIQKVDEVPAQLKSFYKNVEIKEKMLPLAGFDIMGRTNVSFSLDITGYGELEYNDIHYGTAARLNDFVYVSYCINGGAWIQIPNWNSNGSVNNTLIANFTTVMV